MNNASLDRTYFGFALSSSRIPVNALVTDVAKLESYGLPVLYVEAELADWLQMPLTRLRWYTHDRLDDSVWHYVRYSIPKRSGGVRVILAPKKELKQAQRFILARLAYRVLPKMLADTAHGFVPGRSIVTNARSHVRKNVVLRMDLQRFFPSIEISRVRDLFISLGYTLSVASTLALLCTERDRMLIVRDGISHYVSNGPRHLVQGAPTSPALANLIAHDLDVQMESLAKRYDLTYTRYADDLTFSGQCAFISPGFLTEAQAIIHQQGFQVNHKKTSFARQSSRQIITGLVVNDETSTPRELRRRLRAILHNAVAEGLAAQSRDERQNFEGYIQGLIAFVESVSPRQAAPLREAFLRVCSTSLCCEGSPSGNT